MLHAWLYHFNQVTYLKNRQEGPEDHKRSQYLVAIARIVYLARDHKTITGKEISRKGIENCPFEKCRKVNKRKSFHLLAGVNQTG